MTFGRLSRIIRRRAAALLFASRLDRELERELQLHFDALVEEKRAEGLSVEAARLHARLELGNVWVLREACRDERRVNWWHDCRQDVRYGCRTLAAAPGFTAVALMSLAAGIGANAGVVGAMAAIRHDTLASPYRDRLVVVRGVSQDASAPRGVPAADYVAWKARSRTVETIDLFIAGPRDLGNDGDLPGERATGASVTAGYFDTLGVHPVLGRVFTADEARSGASVVLLSHSLWQRRYGGAPDILNRSIAVDNGHRTVIGVMPEEYGDRSRRVDFWTSAHIDPLVDPTATRPFRAVGRLKPGATLSQAQSDLAGIAAALAVERPAFNAGRSVQVVPLRDDLYDWTRQPLTMLQVAVSFVLLMACANVAGLLLARGTVRRREIALRMVLGAGRPRIVRQLLTESLLLAVGGGLLGLLVAWATVQGLSAMRPPITGAPMLPLRLDLRILGVITILAAATGIGCGLAPALTVSGASPALPLDDGGRSSLSRAGHRLRSVLVASQVALALVLLTGFALLANSFVRLAYRDLNFDPANLLTFEVRTAAPHKQIERVHGVSYYEVLNMPSRTLTRVHERLRSIPNVESTGGISFPPVDSLILPVMDVRVDAPAVGAVDRPPFKAAYFLVTPGFFQTMRTPLVRGRDISEADTASRPWVAVINEAAARQFWLDQDPIRRRLTIDVVPEEQPREVVGVVRDIPTRHGQEDPQPVIYASYLQQPQRYRGPFGVMFGQMTFFVRTPGDPLSLVPAVRKAVAEIEPRPIGSVTTAEAQRVLAAARPRYNLLLLGVLAGTGAMLAAIGVYGLLAYAVSLRTREIGIRKALGAGPRAVVVFLCRGVLLVVVAGLAIGSAGAFVSMRLLESQLWGITPTDPGTFAVSLLLLLAIALLACVGPVYRAHAVDPTVALRAE